MAAEKVITTTNMCVRMDDRLMAAEKVIATTTKICMRERMHVQMHGGQMAYYYQNISQILLLHDSKFMAHSRGK